MPKCQYFSKSYFFFKNNFKFIIFNGKGGNGKGVINDLFLTGLGFYGFQGNNSILFEKNRTGSNPEKSNLHRKRYVVFREPAEKNKIENSVVKELTGGGTFSSRSHYEKDTEKELNLTMIVECNKRPLFTEEPTDGDIRRIIDIFFRSKFVTDIDDVNEQNYVYLANIEYKTKEFTNKYKYALLKILFETHSIYYKNNSILKLPESIIIRTNAYLEMSCEILQWFKENYEENNKTIIYLKDIYEYFITDSEYYSNLTKNEKKKFNKIYFIEYFQTNAFLKNFYLSRKNNIRHCVQGWIIKSTKDF